LALLLLIFTSSQGNVFGGEVAQKTYRSSSLEIQFPIPSDWTYRNCSYASQPEKCVEFQKKGLYPYDYLLQVEIKENQDLEQTVSSHPAFEKENGEWIKQGQFGRSKATKLSENNWHGMYAVADCGVDFHDGTGSHSGSCLTAILTNGSRSAIIETSGLIRTEIVIDLVKNFVFIKK